MRPDQLFDQIVKKEWNIDDYHIIDYIYNNVL